MFAEIAKTQKKDYSIDDKGHLKLKGVHEHLICPSCEKMLALRYNNTTLVKSRTIVVDGDRLVIRCRNCKTYITIDGQKKLLTV